MARYSMAMVCHLKRAGVEKAEEDRRTYLCSRFSSSPNPGVSTMHRFKMTPSSTSSNFATTKSTTEQEELVQFSRLLVKGVARTKENILPIIGHAGLSYLRQDVVCVCVAHYVP